MSGDASWIGLCTFLKAVRKQAGLSQSELARRSGLPQRSISHWEQLDREPTLSSLQRWARALDLELRVQVLR